MAGDIPKILRQTCQRRNALRLGLAGMLTTMACGLPGCQSTSGAISKQPDLIWSKRGLSAGRLTKPRAMAIDRQDRIYIVDMTGRIQVFNRDGEYSHGWRTPEIASGRPTGLGIANDGSVLVADTHYFRVLFYTPEGELQEERTIGGTFGTAPAQFHFVTDVTQTAKGQILAGQYGELDQIQEFNSDGTFARRWGQQGSELDCFARPQTLLMDQQEQLWVADACNHRILQFSLESALPRLVRHFGSPGDQAGQLRYPYGLALAQDGSLLVAEFGNHRVQRFSTTGESLEIWGSPGTGPGQFSSPWALAVDSTGATHVLDTLNHRVQRFPA